MYKTGRESAPYSRKAGMNCYEPPILIGINSILYEISIYAGATSITVDLHESDTRNALLGPLLINTELYLIGIQNQIEG